MMTTRGERLQDCRILCHGQWLDCEALRARRVKSDGSEDDSTLGFSYAMDALTVGYTTIKPGSNGSFGDEWDFSVAYAAGALLHLSLLTKQTRLQSLLITHSVAAHLLSQQCTTKLVQTTT